MNVQYKVNYSPQAIEDLEDIYLYITYELYAQEVAKNIVNRIRREICKLDSFPLRFPIVDWQPWKSMNMHKLPVGNYNIFYLVNIEDLTIKIIRILYSGRNVKSMALTNDMK